MENCYILYSCGQSDEPIISNDQSLSAYTGNFVGARILNSSDDSTRCFYVFDLGSIDCPIIYDIVIDPDVECDCPNLCYFVKYGETNQTTTYVNNKNELVLRDFQTGQTFNFCSKIYPVFEISGETKVTGMGSCIGDSCPSTIPTVKNRNECDVLTIFPMSVECLTLNPTDQNSFNGSVQLNVSGGTQPYTIYWEVGSYAPALTNLGPGEYNATVTDYYGDFTIYTTCVLTAETISYSGMCFVLDGKPDQYLNIEFAGIKNTKPYYVISNNIISYGIVFWDESQGLWVFCQSFNCGSNSYYNYLDNNDDLYPSTYGIYSWSAGTGSNYTILDSYVGPCDPPITPVTYGPLCAFYLLRSNDPDLPWQQVFVTLYYNGSYNGQPSWQSLDTTYNIFWNSGSTPNQWVITGYAGTPTSLIASNNPSAPPLSNWQVYGDGTIDTFSVFSGICSATTTVGFTAAVNNAQCNQGGSIMISAYGGLPPYLYSINNGQTFSVSPYFPNLSAGAYNIQVSDVNGVSSIGLVTITNTTQTIYQLVFGSSLSTNTFSVNAPTLPPGVSITFDVVHVSTFTYYPNTLSSSPTPPSYNNIATITGVGPLSLYSTYTSFTNIGGPCALVYVPLLQNQILNTYYSTITLFSNQSISGSVTDQIVNQPTGNCQNANGVYSIQLANVKINNCDCCSVEVVGI